MKTENWKQVDGFESYDVSDCGAIRSRKTGIILRQYDSNCGYKRVVLYSRGFRKRFSVHRLVAQTFIPNDQNLPQVNHKDGNKTNNCVDNLEWCTGESNQQHRRYILKSGLRPVRCIETGIVYESVKSAAEQNRSHIPNIVRACQIGSTASGFHWCYVERGNNFDD